VYTEHGREHDDPPFKQWLDRRAAGFTSTVVAVSNRLARYMATNVGIDPAKVVTIHSGVDTTVFTPGDASTDYRSSLGIPADAMVIGSVGRLETVKAYEHLLTAASMIRGKLARPFVVVIAGDGSQKAPLEAQAKRLGISDIVYLPGWTDQTVGMHRLFDVFVLPSRSEGQSVSLMEAMASGAAPVVTDVGSNAEMLGPDLKEYVVPVERPDALADVLLKVLGPGAPLAAIRAAVRQRAVEHYNLDRMTEAYDRLYRGLDGS
jgi:glycosyltransferase involved in cell wall biosynthesis